MKVQVNEKDMYIQKTCLVCGCTFAVPHWRAEAKYCSPACRQIALHAKQNVICACCGKPFHRKQSHLDRYKGAQGFFCSKECAKQGMRERMSGENNHQYGLRGSKNASFKGQETSHKNHNLNDIMVYVPEHPYCNKDGRVAKHRYVVEQNAELFEPKWFEIINGKRCLKRNAIVHHKNGNHNDNRVENLEIMTRAEHTELHNQEYYMLVDKKTGQFAARIPNHIKVELKIV